MNKKIIGLLAIGLLGCSPKLTDLEGYNQFTRLWHTSRDDFYLGQNGRFIRKSSPFITTKTYSGSFRIENRNIVFVYDQNKLPEHELSFGYYNDTTLTILYVFSSPENSLQPDTIQHNYKLNQKKTSANNN